MVNVNFNLHTHTVRAKNRHDYLSSLKIYYKCQSLSSITDKFGVSIYELLFFFITHKILNHTVPVFFLFQRPTATKIERLKVYGQ